MLHRKPATRGFFCANGPDATLLPHRGHIDGMLYGGICTIFAGPACGEMLLMAPYFGTQDNILFVKHVGSVTASRWCLRGFKRSPI
ncbi:hypothetical protein T281_16185 [Rhodomicrobium udaipurense JA643]|nr:hypothetical protein T281_16185 [Rhodomicrobium udaipurense JA643]